jgi:hypothetical protein
MAAGGNEHPDVLALQRSLLPEMPSGIPETLQQQKQKCVSHKFHLQRIIYVYANLPLSWHVTIASGDTAQDTIKLSEVVRLEDRVIGLGRRMHLGQYLLGECLCNPTNCTSSEMH